MKKETVKAKTKTKATSTPAKAKTAAKPKAPTFKLSACVSEKRRQDWTGAIDVPSARALIERALKSRTGESYFLHFSTLNRIAQGKGAALTLVRNTAGIRLKDAQAMTPNICAEMRLTGADFAKLVKMHPHRIDSIDLKK